MLSKSGNGTTQRLYAPRRVRRTRLEVDQLRNALLHLAEAIQPCTVRQLFYRATVKGLVPKTEQGYGTVKRLTAMMRREGKMPYEYLADNTRWMRKPRTYGGISDFFEQSAQLYRRSVWDSQASYVEIWCEKDALAGVIYPETSRYDVPLMVTRGYASMTFLHSAAESIDAEGKPAHLYYFGDYDPSGCDIPRKVERDLRAFAPDSEIHFERVAVTSEQIDELDLPTRPTKTSDARSKNFDGDSVELDAIEPDDLRARVRRCIEQHIDSAALRTLKTAEASERAYLVKQGALLSGGNE